MDQLPATFVKGFHDEESVRKMQYNLLGKTGLRVSKIGFGSAPFSALFGKFDETEGIRAVHLALRKGINYLDTAPFYGQGRSEEVLGKALKDVPRQAYYVATKVARYEKDYARMFDHSAQKTRESLEKSLKLLGVGYLDVVQIHDVEFAPDLSVIWNETLPTLEKMRDEGKLRFIGITGYPLDVLKQGITGAPGRFDTVLSYSRYTLIDDSLAKYLPFFEKNNLGIVCAAGHAMGMLTNAGPQSWHPAHEHTKQICWEASEYCKQQGVELGKLAMYHFIQLDGPATFLAGIQTEHLVDINLKAFFSGLTEKERNVLNYLEQSVFPKIEHFNWEGVELQRYWEGINSVKK
ncbi:uncharacterized protein LOC120421498 [Culex pipiens pallens]|uniref:uncharacterized protein LOC120421498 n=1 Tax=Culex pipiens pallens TaxID=42434 RepID=UPI0019533D5A|nr:uncharacterized protein LOC120421498 [Culex pipiens pallens]